MVGIRSDQIGVFLRASRESSTATGKYAAIQVGILGLLFWLFVVSAAEETAAESADTRKDFADSLSRFNDTVLHSLAKPESVEMTERVRGHDGDEDFLEHVCSG